MGKISSETKRMLRRIANRLPVYEETFRERKHIHHKDIETKGLKTDKDYDKNTQYQYGFDTGKKLIDADIHFKRLKQAWKDGGSQGYRDYLNKFDKKEFRNLTYWEKFIHWCYN